MILPFFGLLKLGTLLSIGYIFRSALQINRKKFCLIFLWGPQNGKNWFWPWRRQKTDFFSFSSVFSFQEAKEQILPLKMLNKTFFCVRILGLQEKNFSGLAPQL